MQNMPHTWLRPVDAARHLGITPDSLARWRTQGVGPAYSKAGRLVVYSMKALDAWLLARSSASMPRESPPTPLSAELGTQDEVREDGQ